MRANIFNKKFRYSYSNVCLIILVINIFVLILTDYMYVVIDGIPLSRYLGLNVWGLKRGYIWQVFTYMFVHSGYLHLFFNMFGIFNFGYLLEKNLGSKEFLLFYFTCGILSGLTSLGIYYVTGLNVNLVGASGAVYALLFLCSVLYPYDRILLFLIIPLQIPLAVLLFLLIELVSTFLVYSNSNVAHLAHLSGIIFAYLYCLIRFNISPYKVYKSALGRRRY